MTIINPFLLAGKDEILNYQNKRIKDWEQERSESQIDFDHYFSELTEQWGMADLNETHITTSTLSKLDTIDETIATELNQILKDNGILNASGFLNLQEVDFSNIFSIIPELHFLNDNQKNELATLLNTIQTQRPLSFETYTQSMFTYLPTTSSNQLYAITESQSHQIWSQLNQNNVIDNYGILLIEPNTQQLEDAVNQLSGFNSSQKERVLSLLNRYPELSYTQYMQAFQNTHSNTNSNLPTPGIYFDSDNQAHTKQTVALTKEQLDYIRIVAVLEWNVMLITQKGIHKSRVKSADNQKKEKKQTEKENLEYLAKLEQMQKQEANKNKKNSSSKKSEKS